MTTIDLAADDEQSQKVIRIANDMARMGRSMAGRARAAGPKELDQLHQAFDRIRQGTSFTLRIESTCGGTSYMLKVEGDTFEF